LDKSPFRHCRQANELKKIDYNNPKYDDLEEELHDLEDALHVKFGEYLEERCKKCTTNFLRYRRIVSYCLLAKTYRESVKKRILSVTGRGVFG